MTESKKITRTKSRVETGHNGRRKTTKRIGMNKILGVTIGLDDLHVLW